MRTAAKNESEHLYASTGKRGTLAPVLRKLTESFPVGHSEREAETLLSHLEDRMEA